MSQVSEGSTDNGDLDLLISSDDDNHRQEDLDVGQETPPSGAETTTAMADLLAKGFFFSSLL